MERTEKDKMLAGGPYDASAPEIQAELAATHRWLARYNADSIWPPPTGTRSYWNASWLSGTARQRSSPALALLGRFDPAFCDFRRASD